MPEPIDTIRRVNSGLESMNVEELQQARIVLDQYYSNGKADVREARRRVANRLEKLLGYPVSNPPTKPPRSVSTGRQPAPPPAPARSAPSVASSPSATAPKKSGNPVLGLIVLLVIVGSIVYACTRSSGSSSPGGSGATFEDRRGFAWEACKSAVEDQLKAPSTADFESVFGAKFSEAGTDTIVVGAYVDSENGFGAKIRSDWTCSADFAPGSTNVTSATVISISSR